MIIRNIGDQFQYQGITYTVGDQIIANRNSTYEGLFGTITEIRNGDKQQDCNLIPDICCTFLPPFDPTQIQLLESRFSCLYGQKKTLSDINLDAVVMVPEMITVMNPAPETRQFDVFEIREEWISDDDAGVTIEYAFEEVQARRFLTQLVNNEKQNGVTSEWMKDPRFKTGITPLFYESWLDGEYCSNHYRASVYRHKMHMSNELFEAIGKTFVDMQLRKHFSEQITGWEELEGMTNEQISNMIASPTVPLQIREQLERNSRLAEAYWDSVAEAAYSLVKKYQEGSI